MELNNLLVVVGAMSVRTIVIIIILIIGGESWWCSGCRESERIALLELKASFNSYDPNGGTARSLPSWGTPDAKCCEWEGVTCDGTAGGEVTELYLGHQREAHFWYLNASLFLPFRKLKLLDLHHNHILGCVHDGGFERLSRLVYLETLNLDHNKLNNSVLSSLSAILSLKSLSLHSNRLRGSIDIQALDVLINLKEMHLGGNQINRFVVSTRERGNRSNLSIIYLDNVTTNGNRFELESLHLFPYLKTLTVRHNHFQGTSIPQELRNLTNLEDLFLDYSSLSGNFLHSLGTLKSLKTLSLYQCGFKKTLPNHGWCELENLEELDLSGNEFQGMLPSCLGNLSRLRVMDICYNKFNGNLLSSPISELVSLEFLSLSNNNFQIPFSFNPFANLSNLKVLLVDSNKLVAEPGFQAWTPNLQLQVFSMSNCTSENKRLPYFLYQQYDLRIIDLSSNNFSETFPSWLLKNNTRLEEAYLRENSFTGSLELPSHPNLNFSRMDISNNGLQGRIPSNIGVIFPNLLSLSGLGNLFQGDIPTSFGNMSLLKVLDLSNNQLSGRIPKELPIGCTSLMHLKLSNNNLSGKLQLKNNNFTGLQVLYLNGNNFSGNIPESLSKINIIKLDISNNHLSGHLPRWLGKMSSLQQIALSNNHLVGAIPMELCNLKGLLSLDLSENNLSGSIPSCFNPPWIMQVHLNGNKLSGTLGRAFYNCSNMVTLDLGDNNLTGKIPDWIDSISSLNILLLKRNRFTGGIPNQLCLLKQLSIIDLSENGLSGSIPACLSNLSFKGIDENSMLLSSVSWYGVKKGITNYLESMTFSEDDFFVYNKYGVQMSIQEQIEFTTKKRSDTYKGQVLKYMSGIDFSCNKLTGNIPPDVGSLYEIHALNLSHNNITGSIPATFSQLKQVESLDLSYNHLSGRIPPQLTELYALGTFSVAHNNLSGAIPDGRAQFGTFSEISYQGNPLLCGPPLHNSCFETESPVPQIPAISDVEGEDNGFIEKEVFWISFVVTYAVVLFGIAVILYINPQWRQTWFYYVEICVNTCQLFCHG